MLGNQLNFETGCFAPGTGPRQEYPSLSDPWSTALHKHVKAHEQAENVGVKGSVAVSSFMKWYHEREFNLHSKLAVSVTTCLQYYFS